MPQLNPEFFLSQVFWLVITFSFLLIFLWKISLPRINSVLIKRENKIDNYIQNAKKLQTEAEEMQKNIDKQIFNTRVQAENLIKKTSDDLQNKASIQLQAADTELKKTINETAKTIENNKNNIIKDINFEIQEITKLMISKLTTIDISDEEIIDNIQKIQNKNLN
tara:strand:- start:133 stop:627 length:495 start_codon:yes stop_codon:yes gene_type:complete